MKFTRLLFLILSSILFNSVIYGQCQSIYVSPTGTALGDGTEANPMDLQTGVTQACALNRKHVRLIAGTYNLTAKIVVGCDDLIIDGDWEIVAGIGRKNSSLSTTVNVNSNLQTAAYDGAAGTTVGFYIGVEAITRTNFRIEDITFNVKNGGAAGTATGTTGNRGNSVYGFYFRNSSGWVLERCVMNTGSGSNGAVGTNGANGAPGAVGQTGSTGDCDDDCMTNFGGSGGAGGGGTAGAPTNNDFSCTNPGQAGGIGSNSGIYRNGGGGGAGGSAGAENNSGGSGNSGGLGGGGAAAGTTNGAGGGGYGSNGGGNCAVGDGRAGASGSNGAPGAAGAVLPISSNYNIYWEPSGQSANGTDGAGGGGGRGGGGGGGQSCFFCIDGTGSGGGGGGGGGQGGAFGTGGWGGGGTFAIYLFNATGTRNNVTLNSGAAASGGTGGTGGTGGAGGNGGLGGGGNNTNETGGCSLTGGRVCGNSEVGAGGRGGNGGNGGNAGSGGAGAAGVSSSVQLVSGSSSANNVAAGITQIITNQPLAGCTNSEILITKDGGTWGLTGTGAFIQDLNASTSSYSNASASAIVSYTSIGAQSININGTPYGGFIMINSNRALPTFDASMSNTICEGNSFTMNTPTSGVQYEWVIFPDAGNTSTPVAIFTTSVASWPTPVTGTTVNYSVRLRVRENCCGWSAPVYYNFSVVAGTVGPVATGATICENTTATINATGTGVGNINWYSDALGQIVLQTSAGINSTYITPVLTQNTVFYVGEGIGGCPGSLTAVQVTVNPQPIAPSASSVQVCQGNSAILTAAGAGGFLNWYNVPNGGTLLGSGSTYNAGALAAGTYTFYVSEDNGTCSSDRTAVNVVVNSLPSAPTSSPVSVCEGNSATLSGTAAGTIQWFADAGLTNMIGTGSTYITLPVSINTTYYLTQTDLNGCQSSSASVLVTVNPNVVPSMSITASANTICAGTLVNFNSSSVNGGATPVYEWYVNGIAQSNNSANFSSSTLVNGDVISAILTSNAACASPISATSNSVVMTVNPVFTPTVSASASSTTICSGETVTFTAAATNAGSNPTYQWTLNGAPVGSNSSVYTNSSLFSGDQIDVSLTTSETCPTMATVLSSVITMTVNNTEVPFAFISTPQTTICPGNTVTVTSSVTNGGTNPIYNWYIDGISTGISTPTFTSNSIMDGDILTLVVTSSSACASPSVVSSNSITFDFNTLIPATVSIASLNSVLCEGETITFLASPNNAFTNLNYSWEVNGVGSGTNNPIFVSSNLAAGDVVSVHLLYNDVCGNLNNVTSNTLTIAANPIVNAGSDVTIVEGNSIVLSGLSSIIGIYNWSPSSTLNDPTILNPSATPLETTEYTLTVTSPQGCIASDKVLIKVDDSNLAIDNSFTPNDDGINDTWIIHHLELYPELDLKIFNRWGNLLYEQSNSYIPWDGRFKGESLPSETYYYVLDLGNGQEAIKGTVTIVR